MNTAQKKENHSIGCNVTDCRYNCRMEACCSLDQIDVKKETQNATSEHSTCCHSFECK
ncbi:MAG: DUF1540 domain-containing protein [Oscillospiraceae bacterium]|nr:DUF1540 domain-containing protein [Oscillospiraceae bacterium]